MDSVIHFLNNSRPVVSFELIAAVIAARFRNVLQNFTTSSVKYATLVSKLNVLKRHQLNDQ